MCLSLNNYSIREHKNEVDGRSCHTSLISLKFPVHFMQTFLITKKPTNPWYVIFAPKAYKCLQLVKNNNMLSFLMWMNSHSPAVFHAVWDDPYLFCLFNIWQHCSTIKTIIDYQSVDKRDNEYKACNCMPPNCRTCIQCLRNSTKITCNRT